MLAIFSHLMRSSDCHGSMISLRQGRTEENLLHLRLLNLLARLNLDQRLILLKVYLMDLLARILLDIEVNRLASILLNMDLLLRLHLKLKMLLSRILLNIDCLT